MDDVLTWYKLGGLHSNAYISDLFASAYAKEGMKAYVEIVQRKEREIGCDVLTHQKVCLSSVHRSAVFAHSWHSGVVPTLQTV